MKTKTLIFGTVIVAISTLTFRNAQAQDEPAVKVVGQEKNIIKVIYAYNTSESVDVKFFTVDGLFEKDHIKGKDFQTGFMKKYNLRALEDRTFWVLIDSPELSVKFKMIPADKGKWTAQLEQTTYNYNALARR